MLFCRQMSASPRDNAGWYQICRIDIRIRGIGVHAHTHGQHIFSARGTRAVAWVCDTQPGYPTGPNGKPSTGLNDNSGYSISLKRSFALVCMYDHWCLSIRIQEKKKKKRKAMFQQSKLREQSRENTRLRKQRERILISAICVVVTQFRPTVYHPLVRDRNPSNRYMYSECKWNVYGLRAKTGACLERGKRFLKHELIILER